MASKKREMQMARDRQRIEGYRVVLLSEDDLEIKKIAVKDCGLVLYTQSFQESVGAPFTRRHIVSNPNEVPRNDTPTPDADDNWSIIPEHMLRSAQKQVNAARRNAKGDPDKLAAIADPFAGVRITSAADGGMAARAA